MDNENNKIDEIKEEEEKEKEKNKYLYLKLTEEEINKLKNINKTNIKKTQLKENILENNFDFMEKNKLKNLTSMLETVPASASRGSNPGHPD